MNPIEKVERSILIVATTIQDRKAEELIKPEQWERVSTYSPKLFALSSYDSVPALEEKGAVHNVGQDKEKSKGKE